jgi:hypothetical protein
LEVGAVDSAAQEDAPLPIQIGPGAIDRQFRSEQKSGTHKEYPTEPGHLLYEDKHALASAFTTPRCRRNAACTWSLSEFGGGGDQLIKKKKAKNQFTSLGPREEPRPREFGRARTLASSFRVLSHSQTFFFSHTRDLECQRIAVT